MLEETGLPWLSWGMRLASEIHPKKRQFLKDNFNVRQFLGF
jgi:hypothetical protein